MNIDKIISDEVLQKWQNIVNILAELSNVPVALIMRVQRPYIEVFRSSKTGENPYKVGEKEHLTGLYCERVINTEKKLFVKNALKNEDWKDNPDIKLGMISYLGYPIELPNKQIFGTICILDKKERNYGKKIEKLILQFKELVELQIDLAYKKSNLENTVKREEFFRDLISHDINNLLQNVKSSVELLKDKVFDIQNKKKVNEILEILASQVFKGKKLIDNTKVISLLEEKEPNLYKVDFLEHLFKSIKDIRTNFKSGTVKIEITSDKEEIYVRASEHLRDLFDNLLLHSIMHNNNDVVKINIRCDVIEKNQNKYLKAVFTDNGVGISEEEKEIIFQGDLYTHQSERGIGIGLEIVQRLIDLYEGEIEVENKIKETPSKGNIITLLVPLE